jgi:RNA polymerase sigma-70 factor (ECF subfamily)
VDEFQTTRWSMVLAAKRGDSAAGRKALAELCEIYWYPLYVFVRRRAGGEEALDLTQGFFADLLGRNPLARIDPAAGKFRAFLLASLKNYLSREREKAATLKRGGDLTHFSLDARRAEERYGEEPRDEQTPERLFERTWARTVLDRVADRLRTEFEDAGKIEQHRALEGFLTQPGRGRGYGEVARDLGTSEAAVKMAVRRMRKRFGLLLRDEIAQTVSSSQEVDREIRHLLSVARDS